MKMLPLTDAMSLFFAQQAPAAPTTGQAIMQFVPMVLLIAGFYFLFIRPQMKKQKEEREMRAAVKSGDEVITTGGIFGTITNVKDDRFVLRIADNTKIEVLKDAVQTVLKKTGEEKK
jgi:preprotein translocase subunit YajC